ISLLASRDQLEWIGDVVAAAALRPPQGAMDAAIERRLQGIDEQIQVLRESREMDAIRESIERLAVRSGGRDQEIHRAFQMLIGAVRKEIAAVHQRLAELKLAVNAGEPILLVEEQVRAAAPNGHHIAAGFESNGARRHEDRHKPRPPRRLGQPLRGIGSPVGSDEAVSAD
ncbi:MAG: hypothetical protein IT336_15670, partial [Thermomicrobiales bacterium]|nr:hypothetical protein [Thermomicrobiales bacterium]